MKRLRRVRLEILLILIGGVATFVVTSSILQAFIGATGAAIGLAAYGAVRNARRNRARQSR